MPIYDKDKIIFPVSAWRICSHELHTRKENPVILFFRTEPAKVKIPGKYITAIVLQYHHNIYYINAILYIVLVK